MEISQGGVWMQEGASLRKL